MTQQIIYTNPTVKPQLATPAITPEASAQTPAPQVKRISWGIAGRLHLPATAERSQPQRDNRPSRSSSREMRSPQSPKVRMRYVDRGSRLERLPGQRLLAERLDRQTARPALEHLTVLHSQRTQRYWIADAETGEIFLHQAFTTLKHCHEAAAELERTFAIAQVLDMRNLCAKLSPETIESVVELVREHWMRERVAVVLG